jgi:hypothetical protein
MRDSDHVVGIASRQGQHTAWLNREVAYGRKLVPAKPTLIVADQEIAIPSDYECVRMDWTNPLATLAEVERLLFFRLPVVPAWIRDWANLFSGDGLTLDEAVREARQVGRHLTQSLSQAVTAERDEQR